MVREFATACGAAPTGGGDRVTGSDQTIRRVLFVCLGNICRSPSAEGLARHRFAAAGLGRRVVFDSAGVGGWHAGDPPDPRAVAACARRGVDISTLRARQFVADDFTRFDRILAMDADNLKRLASTAPTAAKAKLALTLDFSTAPGRSVPDPYYGGLDGFARMLDLLDEAIDGLLAAEVDMRDRGPASAETPHEPST